MHSRVLDTTVTLNAVVIAACWGAGLVLITVSFLSAIPPDMKTPTAVSAVPFFAFASVRWIAAMIAELQRSQFNVFELGRDYERHHQDQLHSVP